MSAVAVATHDTKPWIEDSWASTSDAGTDQRGSRRWRSASLLAALGALMLLGLFWGRGHTASLRAGSTQPLSLAVLANVTESLGLDFISKGPHTVCRHSSPDDQHHNREGKGLIPVVKSSGLEDCKQQCRDRADCKGIEFRASENRCEIWTLEIKYSLNVKKWYEESKKDHGPADFECFTYERKNGCRTKRDLRPGDEAGSCKDRCHSSHKCCPDTNRCVPATSTCKDPPKDCIGTCAKGWNCCIAQGNQCLKHPIPEKDDLCTCAE